jgi:hypothetical protein
MGTHAEANSLRISFDGVYQGLVAAKDVFVGSSTKEELRLSAVLLRTAIVGLFVFSLCPFS